ncbi:MAG TPA: serine protease [Thermoanaerobaculia bacterium]|nr:serine protease [Thermoanaerobaculia bacterium]
MAKKQPPASRGAAPKTPRRTSLTARISPDDRVALYAAASYLPSSLERECGLQVPFTTYMQDPQVAKSNPALGFDEQLLVDWEPGLADGPTSARFAVVDYNADTDELTPPAEWNEKLQKFVIGNQVIEQKTAHLPQFHQVSVWAILQRALAFFEDGSALGRRIPWAFEGNRLIVVPRAGYGENAFYDRSSKSLQFYYFGSDPDVVYTCLSADIVNHEFGHAVLDGIRPLYNESSLVQTGAFHEFIGDLTAILLTLKNGELRRHVAQATQGNMAKADPIGSIAEEFGKNISGRPYLRTARNKDKMSAMKGETSAHRVSTVLTGAMFDILIELAKNYRRQPEEAPAADGDSAPTRKRASPAQAFWRAADRMQRTAIQPLDLLPPVDVTFRDYALAVCRSQQLADPIDPQGYYSMLIKVFRKRQILSKEDEQRLTQPQYLYDRLRLCVYHDIGAISGSRAAAYRFLDDNRQELLIPANQDFFIADLYDANKRARQGARLPRQIILEYVWREDVLLEGKRFGELKGRWTSMLCGGTLVFDDNGNVLNWAMKPGSLPYGGKRVRGGAVARSWESAVAEGTIRKKEMLDDLASQIAAGRVGAVIGSAKGFLGAAVPPLVVEGEDDRVRFRLSPHLHLSHNDEDDLGARRWEIIS